MFRSCLAFVVVAWLSGCGLCDYREYDGELTTDIGLDESCPLRTGESHDPPGNEGLVSIDGSPDRQVAEPAKQRCCYTGRFLRSGVEFSGELCADFPFEGRGDEPFANHCPAREDAVAQALGPFLFEHEQNVWAVLAAEILSLDDGPRPGEVTLRKDICVYPATFRTTSDACG